MAQLTIDGQHGYIVKRLVKHRPFNASASSSAIKIEYLVAWDGYEASENTWEPHHKLAHDVPTLVQEYWAKHRLNKTSCDLVTRDIECLKPAVGHKRSAPDASDTSDDGKKLDQAEMGNKKLTRVGEAQNASQKSRKMMDRNEKVGDGGSPRTSRAKACPQDTRVQVTKHAILPHAPSPPPPVSSCQLPLPDLDSPPTSRTWATGLLAAIGKHEAAQRTRGASVREGGGAGGGAGGEKPESKTKGEDKHKHGVFLGKGKEQAVEKRKRSVSDAGSRATKQQRGEGEGGEGGCGGAVKKDSAKGQHNRRKAIECNSLCICEHNCQRSSCKQCGSSSICEHNRRRSRCTLCGGSSICEHNRERRRCKLCGGLSICEHNRRRSNCKLCSGASICEHNRRRSLCKTCGGSSICEHNRERSKCKTCGGSSFCEHNRRRTLCKTCGGSSICEHNRERSKCKACGGSSICEHNRERSKCKPCGGSSICEHNRIRSGCTQCGGSSICKHNRRRIECKPCGGSSICEHNRRRHRCKECDGSTSSIDTFLNLATHLLAPFYV
jgi:hypothetical protein